MIFNASSPSELMRRVVYVAKGRGWGCSARKCPITIVCQGWPAAFRRRRSHGTDRRPYRLARGAMPKGVAMRTAIRSSNGQSITAAVARRDAGPFSCDGCGTAVSFVNAHTMHAADPDRERPIHAFFRLVTSRPPSEHQQDCPYTTAGQIRELIASSTAVEVCLRPFVEEDGKQVFRLAMLRDAEKALPRIDN